MGNDLIRYECWKDHSGGRQCGRMTGGLGRVRWEG